MKKIYAQHHETWHEGKGILNFIQMFFILLMSQKITDHKWYELKILLFAIKLFH